MTWWWPFPKPDEQARIRQLLTDLNRKVGKLMTQADDLKAILTDVAGQVAGVDETLDTVRSGIGDVAAEVQTLIDRLGSLPPSADLTEALAQATAIRDHLATVGAEAQGASDSLKAIPKAP